MAAWLLSSATQGSTGVGPIRSDATRQPQSKVGRRAQGACRHSARAATPMRQATAECPSQEGITISAGLVSRATQGIGGRGARTSHATRHPPTERGQEKTRGA